MKTYIALLRGINVSGHRIIKMEALRKALPELGLKNVSTYIQSGNILFQSPISDGKKLEFQIHDLIEKHFGFVVSVIVVTPDELKQVIEKNPFAHDDIAEPQPYVAFLSETPMAKNVENLKAVDFQKDRFVIIGKTMYLHYDEGAGKTKLSNAVIEKKLQLATTSRNWKTIKRLIALADAIAD